MRHDTEKQWIRYTVTALAVMLLTLGCTAPVGAPDPSEVPEPEPVDQPADDPGEDPGDQPTDQPTDQPDDDVSPEIDRQHIGIDFDSATAGYTAEGFAGAGIVHNPPLGYLDAEGWQILGFSDGDLLYGEEATEGDFARGVSTGGVGIGGLYAFEVETDNMALGVQPTGDDFSPGSIAMRVPVTLETAAVLTVEYTLWVYNDQNRSSRWWFTFSSDNETWIEVPGLELFTPPEADTSPRWEPTRFSRTVDVSSLGITSGTTLHLRWSSEDHSGTGGRDEAAIDDIEVVLTGESGV